MLCMDMCAGVFTDQIDRIIKQEVRVINDDITHFFIYLNQIFGVEERSFLFLSLSLVIQIGWKKISFKICSCLILTQFHFRSLKICFTCVGEMQYACIAFDHISRSVNI